MTQVTSGDAPPIGPTMTLDHRFEIVAHYTGKQALGIPAQRTLTRIPVTLEDAEEFIRDNHDRYTCDAFEIIEHRIVKTSFLVRRVKPTKVTTITLEDI
jgi:hypothetical protein